MISAYEEYKRDLKNLISAYKGVRLNDAFINILDIKIDKSILAKLKLDSFISQLIKTYPYQYLNDLFFVRLVTLLEEYLKNRLIQEFDENETSIKNFLLNYTTDRKLTSIDVVNGPKILATSFLDDITFHNMPKVERVYYATFKFDIKKFCDFKRLVIIVKLRHILVHNGGKTKSKEKLITYSLQTCLDEINRLIENIEFCIKNGRPKKIVKRIDIENYGRSIYSENKQDLIDYEIIRAFGE